MDIPKQLKNPDFRFVLLGVWDKWKNIKTNEVKKFSSDEYKDINKNIWKPLGKAPFENKWQNKEYAFDNIVLINHIKNNNFGIIGGFGKLRILDIDNPKLAEEYEKKINTYTVKTGSGGRHFYFISDYDKNHVLINELGELRAKNYQVVSAPCRHPTGNYYQVVKDVDIQIISNQDLLDLIKPYLREEAPVKTESDFKETKKEDTSRSGLEYRKIIALLREGKSREEIYKIMNAYSKWTSQTEQYRSLTFEKAENFVLLEKEKNNKSTIKQAPEDILIILKNPDLLNIINRELDKKIVGENEARITNLIVTNMRNVENLGKSTDNLMMNAPSGSGKDHISEAVFELFPDEEKEELIRTTPKVLAYTRNKKIEPNASWKKTALRLEDVSNEVLNDDAFKVLSSANPNKLNKAKTVNKGKVIDIEIEGKPSIIMTIADANPKEELLRRYPICSLDEGINQTKEILKRQSEFAIKGKTIDYDDTIKEALKYLKRVKVKVTFADKLVDLFCPENLIVRTHFPRFIDYIKSSCSLYQYQREQDDEGFFLATEQDYEIARIVLIKTTSNILMIPLTKIRKNILDVFEKYGLERKSVDDLEDYDEIKKLNINIEWLRRQCDWLASKTFLIKDREKRTDEAGKIIPKPVCIYSLNKLQRLEIPKWNELSSFSMNNENNRNSSNTLNTDIVNEANKVFPLKKCISHNQQDDYGEEFSR